MSRTVCLPLRRSSNCCWIHWKVGTRPLAIGVEGSQPSCFFDERVVAVAAGHAAGGVEVVGALEFDAADVLGQGDQVVDGDQLAGAQVDRGGDELLGVHDLVDAVEAVVDIHEAAGLVAVAPDDDPVAAFGLGFNDLAAHGGGGLFRGRRPRCPRGRRRCGTGRWPS